MKLSLVLIVYRSDSSIAQEASKFCEEVLKAKNIKSRRIISTSICLTLLSLLIRVDLTNVWSLSSPQNSIGEESTIRIGEHLFSDYLLPFEVASVLVLMAMIGAIVLARREVMTKDI